MDLHSAAAAFTWHDLHFPDRTRHHRGRVYGRGTNDTIVTPPVSVVDWTGALLDLSVVIAERENTVLL